MTSARHLRLLWKRTPRLTRRSLDVPLRSGKLASCRKVLILIGAEVRQDGMRTLLNDPRVALLVPVLCEARVSGSRSSGEGEGSKVMCFVFFLLQLCIVPLLLKRAVFFFINDGPGPA